MKTQVQAIGNDHERTDAHVAPLVQFFIWLTVVCAVSFFLMKALLGWFKQQDTPIPGNERHPLAQERVIPPEPRLERAHNTAIVSEGRRDASEYYTSQSLRDLRAREGDQLHTYGWIDKQQGLVHIPIERAMQLVLKECLPTAPKK